MLDALANPSGVPMPVGDIPGWHQVFADDFNYIVPLGSFPSAASNTWWAYADGTPDQVGTWPCSTYNSYYWPSKVISIGINAQGALKPSIMNFYIHTEYMINPCSGSNPVYTHLVAGPIPIIPGHTGFPYDGLTYGRFVIRARAVPTTYLDGYKTAWLLWPDSDNWCEGEIDYPEGNLSSTDNGTNGTTNGCSNAYMHYRCDPNSPPPCNCIPCGKLSDPYSTNKIYTDWHTYTIEWIPGKVTFYIDENIVGTSINCVPSTSMHWVLQTTIDTGIPQWGSVPDNVAAGNIEIDWAVIYSYVPSTALSVSLIIDPPTIDLGQSTTLMATVSGGVPPYNYTWSSLPTGCTGANTNKITCVPTSVGVFNVSVSVTDSS